MRTPNLLAAAALLASAGAASASHFYRLTPIAVDYHPISDDFPFTYNVARYYHLHDNGQVLFFGTAPGMAGGLFRSTPEGAVEPFFLAGTVLPTGETAGPPLPSLFGSGVSRIWAARTPQVIFSVRLSGGPHGSRHGILAGDGPVAFIAGEGDALPGSAATIAGFNKWSVADDARIALAVELSDGADALLVGSPGELELVLRSGDPAPLLDGPTLASFTGFILPNGHLIVEATLAGADVDGDSDEAVWRFTDTGPVLEWREGQPTVSGESASDFQPYMQYQNTRPWNRARFASSGGFASAAGWWSSGAGPTQAWTNLFGVSEMAATIQAPPPLPPGASAWHVGPPLVFPSGDALLLQVLVSPFVDTGYAHGYSAWTYDGETIRPLLVAGLGMPCTTGAFPTSLGLAEATVHASGRVAGVHATMGSEESRLLSWDWVVIDPAGPTVTRVVRALPRRADASPEHVRLPNGQSFEIVSPPEIAGPDANWMFQNGLEGRHVMDAEGRLLLALRVRNVDTGQQSDALVVAEPIENPCFADYNLDLEKNVTDLLDFLTDFRRAHPDADLVPDCQTDVQDLLRFLTDFRACGA